MKNIDLTNWKLLAEIYEYLFFFSFFFLCLLVIIVVKFNNSTVGREYTFSTFSGMLVYILLLPVKMGMLTKMWDVSTDYCIILMFLSDFSFIFSSWALTLLALERINNFSFSEIKVNETKILKQMSFPIIWVTSIFQAVQISMKYKKSQMNLEDDDCLLAIERSAEEAWILLMYTVVIPTFIVFFYVLNKRFLFLERDLNSIVTHLSLFLFFGALCFFPASVLNEFNCNRLFYGLHELLIVCLELKIFYVPTMTYIISCENYRLAAKAFFCKCFKPCFLMPSLRKLQQPTKSTQF